MSAEEQESLLELQIHQQGIGEGSLLNAEYVEVSLS